MRRCLEVLYGVTRNWLEISLTLQRCLNSSCRLRSRVSSPSAFNAAMQSMADMFTDGVFVDGLFLLGIAPTVKRVLRPKDLSMRKDAPTARRSGAQPNSDLAVVSRAHYNKPAISAW